MTEYVVVLEQFCGEFAVKLNEYASAGYKVVSSYSISGEDDDLDHFVAVMER